MFLLEVQCDVRLHQVSRSLTPGKQYGFHGSDTGEANTAKTLCLYVITKYYSRFQGSHNLEYSLSSDLNIYVLRVNVQKLLQLRHFLSATIKSSVTCQ